MRIIVLILLLIAPGMTWADVSAKPPQRSSGYVPYMTGGVGVDEREALFAASKDYGLKLSFAAKDETAFLSDVTVSIATSRGEQVMLMREMGPYLFVKLEPGDYTITASSRDQILEQTARVSAGGQADAGFYW
jgi:hypothetical protein